MEPRGRSLLDQACTELCRSVRAALRTRHYPAHAEETCVAWLTRFILFHDRRHPTTITAAEVMAFLKTLACDAERTAARTAILFLYRQVLNHPLDLPADPPSPITVSPCHPLTVAPRHPVISSPDLAALLNQACAALRVKHYAIRTEQTYLDWIRRFLRYHGNRHPRDLGGAEACSELVEGSRLFSLTWPPRATWPHPPRTKPSPPSSFSIATSCIKNWPTPSKPYAPASRNTSPRC